MDEQKYMGEIEYEGCTDTVIDYDHSCRARTCSMPCKENSAHIGTPTRPWRAQSSRRGPTNLTKVVFEL